MKNILILLITVILLTALSACGSKATELTGADRDAVLAFSESKTDNLLAGLNAGDYGMFSADFDAEMLAAMPEPEFIKLKSDRDTTLGAYLSRSVDTVYQQAEFYVVVYSAVFEKENAVAVRVVFRVAEPHQISGLWFTK